MPTRNGTKERARRGPWSRRDRERLKEIYGLRGDAAVARELRRSVASVRRMAERLFPRTARSGPWTAREELELRRYIGACAPPMIARILGRSLEEVNARIAALGRYRRQGAWTREEIIEFKRLYGTRADQDLGRIFGCSAEEIERLAREHALAKDKAFSRRLLGHGATRMPRWRDEEVALLQREYAARSNLELARKLGRTVKSMVSKAHHLGLRKSSERRRRMGRENVGVRYRARNGARPEGGVLRPEPAGPPSERDGAGDGAQPPSSPRKNDG